MYGLHSNQHRMGPLVVMLLALVLIVVLWPRRPPPRIAPPAALSGEGFVAPLESEFQAEAPLPTPAAAGREAVAATSNFQIYVAPGSYSAEQAQTLAAPVEEALLYGAERTGMQLSGPASITFDRPAGDCGLHAAAYTEARTIMLYACPETPTRRAVNVLAHEWIHQLAHDYYGPAHLQADLILSEGLATWGAGRYWLGRHPSFHAFVATEYGANLLGLATDPRGSVSIARLNQIYYQWASYVEWLDATFGRTAVEQLYRTGKERGIASADYTAVLGIDFAESEARWRAWIDGPAP